MFRALGLIVARILFTLGRYEWTLESDNAHVSALRAPPVVLAPDQDSRRARILATYWFSVGSLGMYCMQVMYGLCSHIP